MSNVAVFPNKHKKYMQTRFGLAEGLLRVLAKKISDINLGDAALTFQMTVIANRLRLANLYEFNNEDPEAIENLIRLMQFAENVTDLAKNRHITKKILGLVEEIQTSEDEYSNIVDVMILIAKRELQNQNKD